MNILLLEPFYASSHKQWVDGLKKYSEHTIDLLTMDGRHWKWRMEHSAVHFAQRITSIDKSYDLILCNDLTNVAVLRGLLQSMGDHNAWYTEAPIYLYFHENQITYPWSETDVDVVLNRDVHYGWINYLSCLAADNIIFNSLFHKHNFLNQLPAFLDQFPDRPQDQTVEFMKSKSSVLPIGVELDDLYKLTKPNNKIPIILWNHRWEYDKNPDAFFQTLFNIQNQGIAFEVIIAGEKYKRYPEIFDTARDMLGDKIIHFGYAKSREEYINLLQKSDIIPVTSNQDFFGISAIEAIAAGCYPLLPDRLAFSEHIQVSNKIDYYYGSDQYLEKKLMKLLTSSDYKCSEVRDHILKYDWKVLIARYDSRLLEVSRS